MLRHAPMLAALQLGHGHEIVRKQTIGLNQRAFRGVERGIAEPVAQAQHMLLEDGLFRNIGILLEVPFQYVEVGRAGRRILGHFDSSRVTCRRDHYCSNAWANLSAGLRTFSSFSSD